MTDLFKYNEVQECQKQLDVKFSEFASMLKDANDYMNDNIDVSHDSAIFGERGKKFLAEWNANAATFSDFYENFRQWSVLMGSILDSYHTFESDTVKEALAANQSDGSGLRGVQAYREALRFNQDQADAKVMYEQMKVQQINPKVLESLSWQKASINNAAVYDSKKVTEIQTKIANGETVFDTDGNAVTGLVLKPELVEDKNFNEFMIYQGVDANGNVNYYSIETDGEIKKLNSANVKELGHVKDTLKVGEEYQNSNDLNGDSAKERIYKASYIVGYHKDSNQTYMALPRSDGSVEYYTVEGKITSDNMTDYNNCTYDYYGKITNINVTATDVKNAGLKPLYEDQTFDSKDASAIKEENKFNSVNQ